MQHCNYLHYLSCLVVAWLVAAKPLNADQQKATARQEGQARIDRQGDPLPPRAIARLGTQRLRHGGSVTALAYSADGKLLASGSNDDNHVIVWEMPSGKRLHQFTVPGAESSCLLFSRDGKRLASSGGSWGGAKVLQVWEMKSGKELLRLTDAQLASYPNSLAFSNDGTKILVVQGDETVCVWHLETEREQPKLKGEGTIRSLAVVPGNKVLALAVQKTDILLLDLTAGTRLAIATGRQWFNALAISPDGKTVAFEGPDTTIVLHDAGTGRELRRLEGHNKPISSLRFSADGKTLLSGSRDGTLRLWELGGGKEQLRLDAVAGGMPFGILSPDGKSVATGGANSPHAVVLWDTATGKELHTFPGQTGPVSSIAVSPNGKLVSTCSWIRGEPTIWLWETATGKSVRQFAGHQHGTCAVAFSPDSKLLASAGWLGDPTVRIWDVPTGRALRTLRGHATGVICIAFSPDGKLLASGDACIGRGGYAGRVRIWNPVNGALVHEVQSARGAIQALQFTPDSRTLLAASDGVYFWDVTTGTRLGEPLLRQHRIWSLALSPDGKVLATGDGAGPVRLWELATRREIATLPPAFNGYCVRFAATGRFLATGTEGTVRLFDWATSEECLTLTWNRGIVTTLAFSADGKSLASGGNWETSALVWDVADVLRRPLQAGRKPVQSVLDQRWDELRGEDPLIAYRAVWRLARVPEHAVRHIRAELKPVGRVEPARVERLLKELDNRRFETRQKAFRELEQLGDAVEGPLQRVLQGKPSLEQRRRIEALLEQLRVTSPQRLRVMRTVFALEQISTAQARELLRELAVGDPDAALTRDALAAVRRLERGQP